ncbi:MAG: hypothetical protein WED86_05545 [Chloroflexota bacterium]
MIDGYSVQEAASVLGVPEGRVWELLARGVLSGTPEGDSMRVFLKPQPGPIVSAGTGSHGEPPRTNGNGGSHGGAEASAFRELLTEFRNLTERYGQALLALGEARGEVAGLRSRVDLLEARLDLRLPPARDAAPVAWEAAPAAAPEPPLPAPATVRAPRRQRATAPSAPPKATSTRKARSSREAIAGFAEALARAEDPTSAEMPGSSEPAPAEESLAEEVLAEVHAEEAVAGVDAAAVAEAVLPVAEAIPDVAPEPATEIATQTIAEAVPEIAAQVAKEIAVEPPVAEPIEQDAAPAPAYTADVVEPDWFADGDFAWLDVADIEARGANAVEEAPVASEPEAPMAAAETDVEAQPEPELPAEPAAPPEPEPTFAAEAEIAAAWEPDPRADVPVEPEAEPLSSFEIAAEPAPSGISVRDLEPELMPPAGPTRLQEPAPEPASEPTSDRGTLQAVSMVEPPDERDPEPWGGAVDARAVPAGHAAGEEELMWLGGRAAGLTSGASEMEVAAPGWRPEPATAPGRPEAPATDAWPAPDVQALDEPRSLSLTEDELARLARDEGWDAAEVSAIRAMISSSPPRPSSASTPLPSIELPGAYELDEAIAALGSGTVAPRQDPSRSWAKAAPQHDEPVAREEWAYEAEPPPPPVTRQPPTFGQGPAIRRPIQDPGWLRTRRGPAAAAYRRLRRLFPG